ncbi:MAG: hypothetical protein Q4B99_00265 [Clostridia bacterium]|nr:hypothetical protein [Clostridia bacterium]
MILTELVAKYGSLSIIGMCKNAGKTTVLNALVTGWRGNGGALALTSIGRDGESQDVVTGTHKPRIYVQEGALIATAAELLMHCDVTQEVLGATGISTPLGEVVIVRARSDGYVQLGGPSMAQQLIWLNGELARLGAELVIIDGAISRKSLCAPAVTEATILCTGASYSPSIEKVVQDTARAAQLLTLPKSEYWRHVPQARITLGARAGEELPCPDMTLHEAVRAHPECDRVFMRGAVTDSMLLPVLTSAAPLEGYEFCAEDASKLLLSPQVVEKLELRRCALSVFRRTELLAVAVNPVSAYGTDFDRSELRRRMCAAVDVPVIDVME